MKAPKHELERPEYKKDTERIQRVLLVKGHYRDIVQCEKYWLCYSDSRAAGWIILPKKDEKVYNCIKKFI